MASVATSTALIVRPVASRPVVHVPKSRTKSVEIDTITVGELCEHFIRYKRTMVGIGELCERSLEQYDRSGEMLIRVVGASTVAQDVSSDDFLKLRAVFSEGRGPHALGKNIQAIRTIFKHGYDCALLDRPMRFGPGFKRPAAKLFRRARHEGGIKMFTAVELRAIIETAKPRVRPMILLGINCGLGNTDCGKLQFSNLDLDNGILDYPRPKTECDRRAFLWPETVAAIRRAITLRNQPSKPSLQNVVFLTGRGNHWCWGEGRSSIGNEFIKTMQRAGIEPRNRAFYTLRRTFRTVADEVGDQPAAMLVMGHIPPSTDMSAIYRQAISDDRLRIVADYVRGWLYPSDKETYQEAYQKQAKDILKLWEACERLRAQDVFRALRMLKMTQTELSRYLGFSVDWINAIVRGREPVSSDTDVRLRAFIQDLANGKHPEPLTRAQLAPQFKSPSDVPLPDEVRAALSQHPLRHKNFRVLIDYLMSLGVTQVRLAEWWGFRPKRVNELAYGRYEVPYRAANRLREIFGLPFTKEIIKPVVVERIVVTTKARVLNAGQLPASAEVRAAIESDLFGKDQLRIVLNYLRSELNISQRTVEKWLGLAHDRLSHTLAGHRRITCRAALRSLFAFAQTGGAE